MLRAAWKSLLGRKLRLALSAMAIVLGVAFVSGSLIFTDMLGRAFNGIFNSTFSDVVVQQAGQTGTGEDQQGVVTPQTVAAIAKVPGVASAQGTVTSISAYILDKNGKVIASQGPPSFGMSWVDGPAFGNQVGLHVVEGRKPARWGEVALDPRSLERSGHRIGDSVRIATTGRYATITAAVVGTATWGSEGGTAGATYAIFDPRTAQKLFLDGQDDWQSVWVAATPGTNVDSLRTDVQRALPKGLSASRGDVLAKEADKIAGQVTGFISTFLLVFAAIALVVGSFLIVNTFSILVAQRSRELALLRALGASRGQVRRSVLLEAFVTGLVGSSLGLFAGAGIARGIAALFGAIGLDLASTSISISARTVLASYAVGMVVTMLAAYWPARRAARVPPVAAMTGAMTTGTSDLGRRAVVGSALAVVGLAALLTGLFRESLDYRMAWIGIGALLTLLGVSAASPLVGRPVTALVGRAYERAFGTVGRLAALNADRNPRRTAATASALMIGLTLVTAMSILGETTKASTHDAITRNLRADYLASSVSFAGFSTTVGDQMAKAPGVQSVHRIQRVRAKIDGERTVVGAQDRAGFDKVIAQKLVSGSLADWTAGTAIVPRAQADAKGWRLGTTIQASMAGRAVPLKVVGITEDSDVSGGLVTPLETLTAAALPRADDIVSITRAPGADPATVHAALDGIVKDLPMVTVTDQKEYADQQAQGIDRLLVIIYGLLALAIVIAILGIVNTLALSVIERTREIGLLRAIGLGRGQLRRMVRLESVVIALLGSVLGIAMGALFGVALQRALAGEGLAVLSIPWLQLVAFLVVAVLVGILAALWPAHRAARLDVLRAISAD